ncbi:MAG: CPBP family intramembrane metalloprotease [Spartobacteria bacterium]|nr:CPBP family intramembrane metalloprotease [Spartobacteria bacterium]
MTCSTLYLLVVGTLFPILFLLQRIQIGDFWWTMSASIVLCITLAAFTDKTYIPRVQNDLRQHTLIKITAGILSALLLYAVFWIGGQLLTSIIPTSANSIAHVYDFKTGASGLRIATLMTLIIGPGEELVWRCGLQERLTPTSGKLLAACLTILLYTGVHLVSGNPVLVLAALVCGTFWGGLYMIFRSPLLNMISHTLWDLLVFLVIPFA